MGSGFSWRLPDRFRLFALMRVCFTSKFVLMRTQFTNYRADLAPTKMPKPLLIGAIPLRNFQPG